MRWIHCPVCFRDRRYNEQGIMLPHRKWLKQGVIVTPAGYYEKGTMVPCEGSGQKAPLS